jgi:hypothetical protein
MESYTWAVEGSWIGTGTVGPDNPQFELFTGLQSRYPVAVIKPVCAIAAQEHRILHAVGADRGGEILGVPDALFLLIIGIPNGGKHEVDAVRSLEGLSKEGDVAHVADGGLSAELDQTFEIFGTSPDDGHVAPLLEEQFRQRLRDVA